MKEPAHFFTVKTKQALSILFLPSLKINVLFRILRQASIQPALARLDVRDIRTLHFRLSRLVDRHSELHITHRAGRVLVHEKHLVLRVKRAGLLVLPRIDGVGHGGGEGFQGRGGRSGRFVALHPKVGGVVRQGGGGQGDDEEEGGKGTVAEEHLCLLVDGFGLCGVWGKGRVLERALPLAKMNSNGVVLRRGLGLGLGVCAEGHKG